MLRNQVTNKGAPLKESTLKSLGIDPNQPSKVRKLEDLINYPPNVGIAECLKDVKFQEDTTGDLNQLKKKNKYVVPLGLYKQLHYDTVNNIKLLRPTRPRFRDMYRPYNGQDLTNKTLLLWRTGGIGDLLFIQPNLIYLKSQYPSCKIILACAKKYQPMIEEWECVDEILNLPFPVIKLGKAHYHAIFEGVIERTIESYYKNSYKLFTKWMGINLDETQLKPNQTPNQEIKEEIEDKLNNNNFKDFIAVQIRTSSPVRNPSWEVMGNILNELIHRGENIIILDSPGERENINLFIKKYLNNKEKVINGSGSNWSKSLKHMIAITSLSKAALSVDSSLVHISASLNIPVFGIYGPFMGYTRMDTYNNVDWIDCGYDELDCAPCNLHGSKPCVNGRPICFEKTLNKEGKVKEVADRFQKLYEG